jgi:hypothetical protein
MSVLTKQCHLCLIFLFAVVNLSLGNTLPWVTQTYSCFEENVVCVKNFINILKVFRNIPSADLCSRMCQLNEDCKYFNFYSDSVNPLLRRQCHLLDSCHTRRQAKLGPDGKIHSGPVGPIFGRKDCSKADCLLKHPQGGQWFWFDYKGPRQSNHVIIVRDDTKVLYFCGDKPLEISRCVDGEMVPHNKIFSCPCRAIAESDSVHCDNVGEVFGGEVEGGTECSKMCGGEVMERSFCEYGEWTVDLSEVECFAEIDKEKHRSWTWVILLLTIGFTVFGFGFYVFIIHRVWKKKLDDDIVLDVNYFRQKSL